MLLARLVGDGRGGLDFFLLVFFIGVLRCIFLLIFYWEFFLLSTSSMFRELILFNWFLLFLFLFFFFLLLMMVLIMMLHSELMLFLFLLLIFVPLSLGCSDHYSLLLSLHRCHLRLWLLRCLRGNYWRLLLLGCHIET